MEALYLAIGRLVVWSVIVVVVAFSTSLALVSVVCMWYDLKAWLGKVAQRKADAGASIARKALTPPPADPSQADTAKLPAITPDPEKPT